MVHLQIVLFADDCLLFDFYYPRRTKEPFYFHSTTNKMVFNQNTSFKESSSKSEVLKLSKQSTREFSFSIELNDINLET